MLIMQSLCPDMQTLDNVRQSVSRVDTAIADLDYGLRLCTQASLFTHFAAYGPICLFILGNILFELLPPRHLIENSYGSRRPSWMSLGVLGRPNPVTCSFVSDGCLDIWLCDLQGV